MFRFVALFVASRGPPYCVMTLDDRETHPVEYFLQAC